MITQTKYLEMQPSDSMLSRRLLDRSASRSFYMDITNGSASKLDSTSGGLNMEQVVLTKCPAAMFRFKSRKVANAFWRWKYMQPTFVYRSTIQPHTQHT